MCLYSRIQNQINDDNLINHVHNNCLQKNLRICIFYCFCCRLFFFFFAVTLLLLNTLLLVLSYPIFFLFLLMCVTMFLFFFCFRYFAYIQLIYTWWNFAEVSDSSRCAFFCFRWAYNIRTRHHICMRNFKQVYLQYENF